MTFSNSNPLVSVIIPTRNSARTLDKCLASVKNQTYKNIEIIVVDNNSTDDTVKIAKKYTDNIYKVDPKVQKKFQQSFSATYQRNFGVKKAHGEIIYYFDADMIMSPNLIQECVEIILNKGADALIIPEDSFGSTFWARCKQLERRCYWGDDLVEAPRCFRKKVWDTVGGLDERVAGGGDDWDLYQKVLEQGFTVKRTRSIVLHDEGHLTLSKLIKKRFLYGKDSLKYIRKRKTTALAQYFPIRPAYLRNYKLFIKSPIVGLGVVVMRIIEYCAGLAGLLYSLILKNELLG